MDVTVQYNSYKGTHRLFVIRGNGPTLLGRVWLKCIQLEWSVIRAVMAIDASTAPTEVQ